MRGGRGGRGEGRRGGGREVRQHTQDEATIWANGGIIGGVWVVVAITEGGRLALLVDLEGEDGGVVAGHEKVEGP
jgi:hypothetical protein